MSISYSAYVVIGFQLDIQSVKVKRQKYNENTGEPYEVEEHSHEVAIVDGVTVGDDRDNPDCFVSGEGFEELEITESGYEAGTKVLGVRLAEVRGYKGECQPFKAALPEAVDAFSKKFGVTPGLFLIQSCG